MTEWQPIEECPKNIGELVDVWVVYRLLVDNEVYTRWAGRRTDARWIDWSNGIPRWTTYDGNDLEYRKSETDPETGIVIINEQIVTHFSPLPGPPTVETI